MGSASRSNADSIDGETVAGAAEADDGDLFASVSAVRQVRTSCYVCAPVAFYPSANPGTSGSSICGPVDGGAGTKEQRTADEANMRRPHSRQCHDKAIPLIRANSYAYAPATFCPNAAPRTSSNNACDYSDKITDTRDQHRPDVAIREWLR